MKKTLETLYLSYTGEKILPKFDMITGSGSNRKYYRIYGKTKNYIGAEGESIEENRSFIILAKHFKQKGLPVPEIYTVSEDESCYLQEDAGEISLFDRIGKRNEDQTSADETKKILFETVRLLPHFQHEGAEGLDFSVCYPIPTFDKKSIFWDLNYFKYCFLKPSGVLFSESDLEKDFERFAENLMKETDNTFMYRDFQSRNVMIKKNQPCFIDFQGGRRGPIYYDLASFVWQAKANFSEDEKNELIDIYLKEVAKFRTVDTEYFKLQLTGFVLFRTLQVLGAYGFRGYFEKKVHFSESIPYALKNVRDLLNKGISEYPCLVQILKELTEMPVIGESERIASGLTVGIYSFSYKKGIPEDTSGNGGGFVFDCRTIHNPGRYDEYKQLTGLDAPVRDFLEKDGEILLFLEHVYALADASTKRYMERDFTHLMFSFGCTGGQHRSVYSAQKLAEHLHKKFNVKIELVHREQNIRSTFETLS